MTSRLVSQRAPVVRANAHLRTRPAGLFAYPLAATHLGIQLAIASAIQMGNGHHELGGWAVALLLVSGAIMQRLVADVLSRDLLGPSDGALARHFATGTAGFASGNRTFAVVYLGLHRLVKLALVAALVRRWLPAYPIAVVVLSAFVIYEVYRATRTGSMLLPFLAVLDVAIIVVIVREYRLVRRERTGVSPER